MIDGGITSITVYLTITILRTLVLFIIVIIVIRRRRCKTFYHKKSSVIWTKSICICVGSGLLRK